MTGLANISKMDINNNILFMFNLPFICIGVTQFRGKLGVFGRGEARPNTPILPPTA
jgi:hypothetical protein